MKPLNAGPPREKIESGTRLLWGWDFLFCIIIILNQLKIVENTIKWKNQNKTSLGSFRDS